MQKILIVILSVFILVSCTRQTSETQEFILPEGLKDCRIFRMDNGQLTQVIVVRCPNSSTTVKYNGKHSWETITVDKPEITEEPLSEKSTIVINGKEYVEK